MADGKGSSSDELEQKIDISIADLEKVFQKLAKHVSAAAIRHKFRPRAYYDTPDLLLNQNGISLRVQYKQGEKGKLGFHEQTVKLSLPVSQAGGALLRKECKDQLPTSVPDMSAATDATAQAALQPFKGKSLTHIFTAAVERRAFDIEVKRVGKVEVAFDIGELTLPGTNVSERFAEIEVELKKGDPILIDTVTKEILRLAPAARVQPQSKADQGITLYLKHNAPKTP